MGSEPRVQTSWAPSFEPERLGRKVGGVLRKQKGQRDALLGGLWGRHHGAHGDRGPELRRSRDDLRDHPRPHRIAVTVHHGARPSVREGAESSSETSQGHSQGRSSCCFRHSDPSGG